MTTWTLRAVSRLASTAVVITVAIAASPSFAQEGEYAKQQRGHYLFAIGDCAACHTAEGGAMPAGGRPIETPFGVIYSPNITPDPETGIGSWSDEQFYRALHNGIAQDGSHLYPAFPYPWFTKAKREDVDAIRAYLRTVPAVKNTPPNNKLPWPLSERTVMVGWNELYFKPGPYQSDPKQTAQWNRGAYLVEGLGHCGACHTPKNMFGAVKTSQKFQGSDVQNWFAPDLTGNALSGLGNWSVDEIVAYLKTGKNNRTVAYGPMAEVVVRSTSKIADNDLAAMATYLESTQDNQQKHNKTSNANRQNVSAAGKAIYADACSACHQENGEGVSKLFPALKGDAVVQSIKPTNIIRLVLNGGHAPSIDKSPTTPSMPAFGWKLSDEQIGAVATYVRSAWSNNAPAVSASEVKSLRNQVQNSPNAN